MGEPLACFQRGLTCDHSWILAFIFVDHLSETYRALTLQQLAVPILLGAGWGVAQILFGVSVKRLGLGIAYAIIVASGSPREHWFHSLFNKERSPRNMR